jgi:16S rRNA (guanine527-N7)-methyltransferase
MMSPAGITERWSEELEQGLEAMGLPLQAAQRQALLDYLVLLQHWNGTYNLSAVRDPAQMVSRHLLDSLSILPWLHEGPVLDMGSGAGLPGIPLSIARPELAFTLADSNRKRTRFLQQVVGELGLRHVQVMQSRVETIDRPGAVRTITSRAFASLADMFDAASPLLAAGGQCLAMKGRLSAEELLALPEGVHREVLPLTVPGQSAVRHLVILSVPDTD